MYHVVLIDEGVDRLVLNDQYSVHNKRNEKNVIVVKIRVIVTPLQLFDFSRHVNFGLIDYLILLNHLCLERFHVSHLLYSHLVVRRGFQGKEFQRLVLKDV